MALGLVEPGNSDDSQSSNETFLEDTQKISTSVDGDGTLHHQDGASNLVWSLMLKHLGTFIAGQCHSTYILQPTYYHIGCAFFLLAFLAPSHRYGAALYMRCMLVFGCILFAMWSYLTECRPDVLIWSAVFIMANLIHMVILICRLRPVSTACSTISSAYLNVLHLFYRTGEIREGNRRGEWVVNITLVVQATCKSSCGAQTSRSSATFPLSVIKSNFPASRLASFIFAMQ